MRDLNAAESSDKLWVTMKALGTVDGCKVSNLTSLIILRQLELGFRPINYMVFRLVCSCVS
jgi:hypothetical protein